MLDVYSGVLGQSDAIDELILKLHSNVKAEVGFQKQIKHVIGAIDLVVSAASMQQVPAVSASAAAFAMSNS